MAVFGGQERNRDELNTVHGKASFGALALPAYLLSCLALLGESENWHDVTPWLYFSWRRASWSEREVLLHWSKERINEITFQPDAYRHDSPTRRQRPCTLP